MALESWHVLTSLQRSLVIVTTELEDDATFAVHAQSEQSFDRWFKDQVKEISGISLDETPRGEPSREAYCWRSKP